MASEDWRQCLDWLLRCGVVSREARVTRADAEPFELAQMLRDGVVICNLLNTLKPASLGPKEYSTRPQMLQFLCFKNIRAFLVTVKSLFGLVEEQLFDPHDLYELKDFRKVIETLSKLSKCDVARQRGITGFPSQHQGTLVEHDYYNLLEDLATTRDVDEAEVTMPVSGGNESEEEDIYDTLCSMRGGRDRRESQVTQPTSKRDFCVRELCETEKNYVDALNMIIMHFVRPLKTFLHQQDMDIIFKHIEDMALVHTGFHSDLRKACQGGSASPSISSVFIGWKKKFLVYGDFCSNLPKAQELLDDLCRRSETIKQAVFECQVKANQNKFKLRDLLAVPMQRVLKYHLLLQELNKNTLGNHDDKAGLEAALGAIKDLSLYINEVKRDNEVLQLIVEIQASISDLFMPENLQLKDYGHLLKDGELKVKSHADQRTKIRYIFLFDKVMVMCKSKGETYSFKSAMVLHQYRVDDVSARGPRRQGDKWNSAFQLTELDKSGAFTFYAKTDEIKEKWIEAIHMAHNNMNPPNAHTPNHDFVMHTFPDPTECAVCTHLLRGVFYQGYLCEKTTMAVHKECIGKAEHVGKATPELPPTPPRKMSSRSSMLPADTSAVPDKVRAIAAYQGVPPPGNRMFLRFVAGDVIEVVNRDDPNWWMGRLKANQGLFPSTYVDKYTGPTRRGTSYVEASPNVPPRDPVSRERRQSYSGGLEYHRQPWFVGQMERNQAVKALHHHGDGTFLIRQSLNHARMGEFSLSIKYQNNVKHIKVNRTADGCFTLVETRRFPSIPELVEYYQHTMLDDYFPELHTTLVTPYKQSEARRSETEGVRITGYCRAAYDYAATQPTQLTLVRDDRIAIISKIGGDRGWWKGELNGRVGYFPHAYVDTDDSLAQVAEAAGVMQIS